MANDNKIGVYDSGVGGLTVLSELVKLLPREKYIYFGDLKNLPYGEKTEADLLLIGRKIFNFFESKKVKAVVMACNTTSALLYDKIKNDYSFKIYPVIQTVARHYSSLNIKKLGVLATQATINSHAYKIEIEKHNRSIEIFEQACPQWVKIVEAGSFADKDVNIVLNDLENMLEHAPDKIILGCTHYPYLLKILSKIAKSDIFINPALSFAKIIADDLKNTDLLNASNECSQEFFVSKNPKQFVASAKMFYDIKNEPTLVDL